MSEPQLALQSIKGLIVLDEIQRREDFFPLLRVLADRKPLPARFLILGSASPELLRQSSETLAGRMETIPLEGIECKRADSPRMTPSIRTTLVDLKLHELKVV